MKRFLILAIFILVGCSNGDNTYTSQQDKPDCDSLKGSAKIQAMNCK